jgi:LEA14-like dessication related protein
MWRRTAWALALGGCTPLGLWLYEDPVVTVSHITLQLGGVQASAPPVVVALQLQNANDYPLSTKRVELSLRVDGMAIGQLQRDSAMEMATDTVSTIALPLSLDGQTTRERLQTLNSGTHTFAVRGRATFRTPIGTRKVRFAEEGSLVFNERRGG